VHTWTRAASLNADQAYVIDRKIISWSGVVQLWRRRVVKYERRKRSGEKRNPYTPAQQIASTEDGDNEDPRKR
jgi:hypothetical protein